MSAAHVLDSRHKDGGQQSSAQRALLDDPGKRALAELVRGEGEHRTAVAHDAHRLDRLDALARQGLPGTHALQECGAAGAYCIYARIPRVGVDRRRALRPIEKSDGEADARERGGEREADQARTRDDDVAPLPLTRPARTRLRLPHRDRVGVRGTRVRAHSVSITSCWFV